MMTDPISDMLTRIRNAGMANHSETTCSFSKKKLAVAKVLEAEGFVGEVSVEARDGFPVMIIGIRYEDDDVPLIDGIKRVSTPGRRVYVGVSDIPKVRNGLGVAVMSTSRGVISDDKAREELVGGEVMCEVW
jgi:small subunit ribosomal protein S8